MSENYCIYLITNLVNGKFYVGKSNHPTIRWGDHKKVAHGGKEKYPTEFFAIHAALSKYGADNFRFEIIDELDNEQEAYRAETCWILLLCSNLKDFGYNCNLGGEGGVKPNEETRKKLIASANKPERIKIASDTMKKQHQMHPGFLSAVHRGNQYTKGRILPKEEREHLSQILTGRVVSEGTKQKMSEAQSGENHSQAKLTKKDVLEIRELFNKLISGKKQFCETIAKKYNVNPKTIENVVYRLSWINI